MQRAMTENCKDRIADLERQLKIANALGSKIQEIAMDLSSAANLENLIETVLNRCKSVVDAEKFILLIRRQSWEGQTAYSIGLDEETRDRTITAFNFGTLDKLDGSYLGVEVESLRRPYGHIIAIRDQDSPFIEQERDVLSSYASFAAVAIDARTASDELRIQTSVAQAMLDLTRDLAAVSSIKEVAYRVATIIPRVLPTNRVAVWLWDERKEGLSPVGFMGIEPDEAEVASSLILKPHRSILFDMMIADHEPALLGVDLSDPYLENLFEGHFEGNCVLVPVIAGGRYQSVITAIVGDDAKNLHDETLLECLRGIADQTSMAFTNARLVERVRHQAMHDSLTGLPNQRLFEDRVRTALAASRRSGQSIGLLFLDLDRFKVINDSMGHRAGDDLLGQVASRLSLAMREEDTVARLGGDEFVLLISKIESLEYLEALAERVQDSLRESFIIDGQSVSISSSVGIVVADATVDDYQSLVRCADIAMYRAKSRGRDCYAVYSPMIDAQANKQMKLEGDLQQALAKDELQLLYQPMVELTTMQIVGVEALVRWNHPKLGMLTPDAFVPMAEETGLIVPVDAWVLKAACRQANLWRKAGFPPMRISVNLSINDLREPDLVETVRSVLSANEINPAMLELEVGETAIDGEDPNVIDVLERLKEIGVKIAIDDFGTGGFGLRQLRSLPIDTLKIDKSFVQELTAEQGEAPLLAAMISMARDLRVLAVAEGVESVQQGSFLRGKGCDLAQGYFFSHPITPEAITRILKD